MYMHQEDKWRISATAESHLLKKTTIHSQKIAHQIRYDVIAKRGHLSILVGAQPCAQNVCESPYKKYNKQYKNETTCNHKEGGVPFSKAFRA